MFLSLTKVTDGIMIALRYRFLAAPTIWGGGDAPAGEESRGPYEYQKVKKS